MAGTEGTAEAIATHRTGGEVPTTGEDTVDMATTSSLAIITTTTTTIGNLGHGYSTGGKGQRRRCLAPLVEVRLFRPAL